MIEVCMQVHPAMMDVIIRPLLKPG